MGVSLLPTFPVELVPNRTVSTTVVSGVGPLLDSTPYSFAFWQLHDVLLVQFLISAACFFASLLLHLTCDLPFLQLRHLGAASMYNKAGNVVEANSYTVTNALSDYISTAAVLDYTGIVLGTFGQHFSQIPVICSPFTFCSQPRAATVGRLPRSVL